MDEKESIQPASRSNLAAFNHLVATHQSVAFNLAARLLGNRHCAESVLERAVAQTFAETGAPGQEPSPYSLLRAVVRFCQAWPQGCSDSAGALPDQIQLGLNQLPFEQRLLLVLADICALSRQEVEMVMDLPEGAVGPMLGPARAALRTFWFGPASPAAAARPQPESAASRTAERANPVGYKKVYSRGMSDALSRLRTLRFAMNLNGWTLVWKHLTPTKGEMSHEK